MSKRTGRAFGLAVGFGIVLLYNKIIEFGQAFAALGAASPWLTLWLPFVLYAVGVGYLYWQSAFKVGANPFAWLEAIWDGLHGLYVRFMPTANSQTQ
jgi:lipopolysaccharide export system permease protein